MPTPVPTQFAGSRVADPAPNDPTVLNGPTGFNGPTGPSLQPGRKPLLSIEPVSLEAHALAQSQAQLQMRTQTPRKGFADWTSLLAPPPRGDSEGNP